MRIICIRYLQLNLFVILCCIMSLSVAQTTPTYTQRYTVTNNSGTTIESLAISDYVMDTGSDEGMYHDPVFTVESLESGATFPSTLAQGGMVSYMPGQGWNGWDISYCTSSQCYQSDFNIHTCAIGEAGSEGGVESLKASIQFLANAKIHLDYIDIPSEKVYYSCDFDLSQPVTQQVSPDDTEHYKVRNDSSSAIYNLAVSDFVEDGDIDKYFGYYQDPVVTAKSLDQGEYAPSSGLGGLVSYFNGSPFMSNDQWNGWSISYCTSTTCYKSDVSVAICTLDSDDVFSGSTSIISIEDNTVIIYKAKSGNCSYQLSVDKSKQPTDN